MIRFFFRWAFRLLLLAIVLAVALILSKDVLAKAAAEYQIRRRTGMDVQIRSLELGLSAPTLTIGDLKLYNPAEFGGSPLLDMPDLHLEYRPGLLLLGRLHLNLARVSIAEVNIVEARDGRTNLVTAIQDLAAAPSSRRFDSLLGFKFDGIDVLNISLGKLRYASLRRPGKTTDVEVGLRNEIFTDLKSLPEARERVLKRVFKNGVTVVGGR